MGKELWGHVDGSDPAPNDYIKLLQQKAKDVKVMCWILEFANPNIVLDLRPCMTAQAMYEYLKKVCYQENSARCY